MRKEKKKQVSDVAAANSLHNHSGKVKIFKSCSENIGMTSHQQPRQCRGPGAQNGWKGAQIDPNYLSRQLLDCVPIFLKIITPAYLGYFTVPDRSLFIISKFRECLPGAGQKL